ncbi:glycosyltransferase, partial [Pseudonocardia oceani]
MTRTAVITPVRGRAAHLHRQREALAVDPPDVHVVVAMGAEPELADVPGAPPVAVVRVPVPTTGLPLSAARNAGAAAAAGADLLVFLDVDCIPAPGMLRRYADAARRVDGPA